MTSSSSSLERPTQSETVWPALERALPGSRFLVAPGLQNSGPDHWQTRWQQHYAAFARVEQDDWEQPDLPAWSAKVDATIRQGEGRVLIVAHSFGCLAAVHRFAQNPSQIAGLFLVAPPDPDKFGLAGLLPQARLGCPSTVVSSTDDPWMEAGRAVTWAERWGSVFVDTGAIGHVNTASGLGDWQFGLDRLAELAARIQSSA